MLFGAEYVAYGKHALKNTNHDLFVELRTGSKICIFVFEIFDTKDVAACVIDTGTFMHVARRLSREYSKVYYWSPWETAFPKFRDAIICDGYEEVTRVESVGEVEDDVGRRRCECVAVGRSRAGEFDRGIDRYLSARRRSRARRIRSA